MFSLRVTVLLVICSATFRPHTIFASEPIVIRAAVAKEFQDGLHSRYLKYIANQLGMEIEITVMPLARRIVEVNKGNLDLIVGLQYSQERANELLFIFPAYESLSFRYFSLKQDAESINSYDDLHGKIIGVIRGASYFSDFEQDVELQKYPFSNLKTNIDMLLNGRIDIFLHYEESTLPLLKSMGVDHLIKKINYQPKHSHEHYLAISKNSLLAAKAEQLKTIVERGIDQQDFIQLRLEHYQQDRH